MNLLHPCETILIKGKDGIPRLFQTKEVYNMISDSQNNFGNLLKERIRLYNKSLNEISKEEAEQALENKENLYLDWIEIQGINAKDFDDKVRKIKLKAQCFIYADDLVSKFGKIRTREEAIKYLEKTGRFWILRESSIQDSEYNKAYALTVKHGNNVCNYAIIHSIGEGFYFDVNLRRGSQLEKVDSFGQANCYPTIIHLLEGEIPFFLERESKIGFPRIL